MNDVLAVDVGPAVIERLLGLGLTRLGDIREVDRDDLLKSALHDEHPAALLVGPDADDPLTLVQRVHMIDSELPVIVLAGKGRGDDLGRALRFTPFVGAAAVCIELDDHDAPEALAAAIDAARQRLHHRQAVTQLNQAAEGIRAQRPSPSQYLGQLFEQAPAGVVMLDEHGAVVSCNRRAVDVLRVSQHELLGEPFDHLFIVEEGQVAKDLLDQATGGPVGPFRLTRRDADRELIFEASAGPVVGRAGQAGLLLLLHDITSAVEAERERRRAQETLRYQASLLQAQSEASFEGILVVDRDGHVLSYNRRFLEMWEIPEDAVSSASGFDIRVAAADKVIDPDAFLTRIRDLYAHPHETSIDRIELRDGRVFERYGAPIGGTEGASYGRVWFFRDVTDRTRREQQLRFLADAGQIFAGSMDAREVLERLAQLFARDVAEVCIAYVSDRSGGIRRAAVARRDGRSLAVAESLPEPLARIVGARSATFCDVGEWGAGLGVPDGERSAICASIVGPNRPLGALVLLSGPRPFDEHDLLFAQDVAARAGLALQNAILFEERSHVAKVLQESLLPPVLPTVAEVEVGSTYSAAGEAYDVGGDFYDLFFLGGSRWAAIVGDVVGKGPQAAALTALTRYVVRAAGLQFGDPATVLKLLNQAILHERGGEMFCTASYVVFEKVGDTFSICMARGGHPPAIVLRASGDVEVYEPSGMLLGIMADVELEQANFTLSHGDALVLFTDGVTEARGPDGRFGHERLEAFVAGLVGLSASDIAQRIEREVRGIEAGVPSDDIAILVLRAMPGVRAGSGAHEAARIRLEAAPESPRAARAFVRDAVAAYAVDDEVGERLVLLTDELVTNAVIHAATPIELIVTMLGDAVHIEVRDESGARPVPVIAPEDATGGRGLFLVEAMSQRWGVNPTDTGKAVWFELPLAAPAP